MYCVYDVESKLDFYFFDVYQLLGENMKKEILFVFCPFVLLFFISCDPGAESKIEIFNKSSYDLNIVFTLKTNSIQNKDKLEFDIKINESVSFSLYDAGGFIDPNNIVLTVVLKNIDSREIIKELVISRPDNVFKLIKSEKDGFTRKGYFILDITDHFLDEA